MPYVDGTVVDYVSEGVNKLFKFDNPRATDACGCGESFSAVRKQ
jgi:Fe-S cluster assembly protein SufA